VSDALFSVKQKKSKILHSSKRVMKEKYDEIFFFQHNKEEVFQYGYSIILKVLKYVLQSRSYMHVAARGAPFTRAHHLYTNVLFFFYVIIFLFVLSLFVILMILISISTSHAYYH
jgi:hypothetical protein